MHSSNGLNNMLNKDVPESLIKALCQEGSDIESIKLKVIEQLAERSKDLTGDVFLIKNLEKIKETAYSLRMAIWYKKLDKNGLHMGETRHGK